MYSLVKLVHTYKIVKRNFTLDENGIVYKTLLHPFLLLAYDKSCLVPVLFLSGTTLDATCNCRRVLACRRQP